MSWGEAPRSRAGFFWAFADEVHRAHRPQRPLDSVGNAAPDGMVGPRHEKEGSFFAVKELWSPVVVTQLRLAAGKLSMQLENRYDFTDLESCTLQWRALRLPGPHERGAPVILATAPHRCLRVSPRASRSWELSNSPHRARGE